MTILQKITITTLISVTLAITAVPVLAQTPELNNLRDGLNVSANRANLDTETSLSIQIGNILNIVFLFVGVLFLIYSLLGGYWWMTAGGNEEKVKSAKGAINGGIEGMIVVFLSYSAVYLIITALGLAAN